MGRKRTGSLVLLASLLLVAGCSDKNCAPPPCPTGLGFDPSSCTCSIILAQQGVADAAVDAGQDAADAGGE
jgi:hypothetical protein